MKVFVHLPFSGVEVWEAAAQGPRPWTPAHKGHAAVDPDLWSPAGPVLAFADTWDVNLQHEHSPSVTAFHVNKWLSKTRNNQKKNKGVSQQLSYTLLTPSLWDHLPHRGSRQKQKASVLTPSTPSRSHLHPAPVSSRPERHLVYLKGMHQCSMLSSNILTLAKPKLQGGEPLGEHQEGAWLP